MKIFAITCNQHNNTLTNAEFFQNLDKAKERLKVMKNERKNNLGVHMHKDSDDEFSFTLGWEESFVVFKIVELMVK